MNPRPEFLASTLLPDAATADPALALALPPALQQEVAHAFAQLGVQRVRASLVERSTLALPAEWTISDLGALASHPVERTLESVFPGARQVAESALQADPASTRVQRLSPRRWAFAWRVDEAHAIVAQAHFRDRRDALATSESAALRLACSAAIGAGRSAEPGSGASTGWPHVDRRRPQDLRTRWRASALALVIASVCGWLLTAAIPRAADDSRALVTSAEQQRLRAEGTLALALSAALKNGDYGEVQSVLSQFFPLAHFRSAVVGNERGRVVATAGSPAGVRIGDPMPADNPPARAFALILGSERQGRLQLVDEAAAAAPDVGALRTAVGLCAAGALGVAALVLPWGELRRLRRR